MSAVGLSASCFAMMLCFPCLDHTLYYFFHLTEFLRHILVTTKAQRANMTPGSAMLGAAHGELQLEEKANGALTSRAKHLQELSDTLALPSRNGQSPSSSEAWRHGPQSPDCTCLQIHLPAASLNLVIEPSMLNTQ